MKLAVCLVVVAVALLASSGSIEAYPLNFGGQVSGVDAKLQLSHGVGTEDHNVLGSVFAAGSTRGGPVALGGSLAYNNNGHGVALTKEHIPGVSDTFTQSGHVNLFKNDAHSITANAFASQNKLANGINYERNGVGLEWNHANGHSANAVLSNVPGNGKQFDFGGRANLWQSQDRNTRLDLNVGGSKSLSGSLSDQKTNFGGGLRLTHVFG